MLFSFMIIWENGKTLKGLDNYELHEIMWNASIGDIDSELDELMETGSVEYFDYEYNMKATAVICAESVPKQKKKVFSLKHFIEDMINIGMNDEEIMFSIKQWAMKCDGLTENEMNETEYIFHEDWLKEVEE